jgi:hypothetical protein
MDNNHGVDVYDIPLDVLVPVREVAFDTLMPANDYNISIGRIDPRMFMKDTDFQVTYSFSTRRRINTVGVAGGEYGAPNMTFRQLYDFLCTEYNHGYRFIDTYFQYIFPSSAAGRKFAQFENTVRESIRQEWFEWHTAAFTNRRTKAGLLHKATERRLLREFSVWKSTYVAETLRQMNKDIRKEIAMKLSNHAIPLQHHNRQRTEKIRLDLGLPPVPEFFTTGQLIRDIQIDIRIPEDAFAWG